MEWIEMTISVPYYIPTKDEMLSIAGWYAWCMIAFSMFVLYEDFMTTLWANVDAFDGIRHLWFFLMVILWPIFVCLILLFLWRDRK